MRGLVLPTILSTLSLGVLASKPCPQLGAVFPPPSQVGAESAWKSFAEELSRNLTQYIQAGRTPYAPIVTNESSISIRIMSADSKEALFDFHRAAPALANRTINADTVYRVGSISKLMTTYALLIQKGYNVLNDPIAKYLSEIQDPEAEKSPLDRLRWDEVTLGALASHQAGVSRQYYLTDFSTDFSLLPRPNVPLSALGLPPLKPEDIPTCNPISPNCSASDFLKGIKAIDPLVPTYSTPVYSNLGFDILGFALQNITNSSYGQALNSSFLQKLKLSRTSVTTPPNSWGILTDLASGWPIDTRFETPSGGVFSSTSDLCTLGQAILNNAQLSPGDTRRWLRPQTHTNSLHRSIGAPWEIYRHETDAASNYAVDIYSKAGDIGSFASWLAVVPDYNLVISLAVAGRRTLREQLLQVLISTVLPKVHEIAKKQAQEKLAGSYESVGGVKSAVTLATDEKSGLVLASATVNGTSLGKFFQALAAAAGGNPPVPNLRLFPTGLRAKVPAGENGVVERIGFRILREVEVEGRVPSPSGPAFDDPCLSWATAGDPMYGNVAVDSVVIGVDKEGKGKEVELRGFRAVMGRK